MKPLVALRSNLNSGDQPAFLTAVHIKDAPDVRTNGHTLCWLQTSMLFTAIHGKKWGRFTWKRTINAHALCSQQTRARPYGWRRAKCVSTVRVLLMPVAFALPERP
jgi:hypothetical protein